MHVRLPNSFIKRDQWINLCIDLNSITEECFSKNSKNQTNGGRVRSRGDSESRSIAKKGNAKLNNEAALLYQAASPNVTMNSRNGFKSIEYV